MVRGAPALSVVTLVIAHEAWPAVTVPALHQAVKHVLLLPSTMVTMERVLVTPVQTIILTITHLVPRDALAWEPSSTPPISLDRTFLVMPRLVSAPSTTIISWQDQEQLMMIMSRMLGLGKKCINNAAMMMFPT